MFGKKTITIFVEESVKVGFTEREKGDQHEKERNKYHWEAADDRSHSFDSCHRLSAVDYPDMQYAVGMGLMK